MPKTARDIANIYDKYYDEMERGHNPFRPQELDIEWYSQSEVDEIKKQLGELALNERKMKDERDSWYNEYNKLKDSFDLLRQELKDEFALSGIDGEEIKQLWKDIDSIFAKYGLVDRLTPEERKKHGIKASFGNKELMPKMKYIHKCNFVLNNTGEKCPKCGEWTYADECILLDSLYSQSEVDEKIQQSFKNDEQINEFIEQELNNIVHSDYMPRKVHRTLLVELRQELKSKILGFGDTGLSDKDEDFVISTIIDSVFAKYGLDESGKATVLPNPSEALKGVGMETSVRGSIPLKSFYEAFARGYRKCCDDHNILYGDDAEKFLAEMNKEPTKEQTEFLDKCVKLLGKGD